MLDMGFIHDIRRIMKCLPGRENRQSLLFSATFSKEIRQLASQFLNRPERVEVSPRNSTVDLIDQLVCPVDKRRKRELLSHMIGSGYWKQVLVFTRTKHGANRLARQLEMDGLSTAAIHGNKSQAARTRSLSEFKNGDIRVLVATDIAARGLDIDQLPHVVNYELPNVPEDYIHRIGRTGRAGNEGTAVSLVSPEEIKMLKDIERLIRREIPQQVLEGYEVSAQARPADTRRNRPGAKPAGRQANRSKRGKRPAARKAGAKSGYSSLAERVF